MKILITGGNGFIASKLIQDRVIKGDTVRTIVRNVIPRVRLHSEISTYVFDSNISKLDDYFREEKFDGVVHLATKYIAEHSSEDIPQMVNSNILFGTIVAELAVKYRVRWFINVGTFVQHFDDKEYNPTNLYAATKQAYADILKYYSETSETIFTTLTLFDTFGKGDTRKKLMDLLLSTALSGAELKMSPGYQLIDIGPVENVIDGFDVLISKLNSDKAKNYRNKNYALPSGRRMTLRNLAKLFSEITNTKLNIQFGARKYRKREVMIPWSSFEKLPDWEPKISLEEGIRKFTTFDI